MFTLDTDQIPATLAELTQAIDASVRRWVQLPADRQVVLGTGKLPALAELRVDVTQGKIESNNSLPFEAPTGPTLPGPTVAAFAITASPVLVSTVPVQLDLTADNAVFSYATNDSQKLIAILENTDHGQLSIRLTKPDLEVAVLMIATRLAGEHVAVQKVQISLTSLSPTQVQFLASITAKKFVTAIIQVSGEITVDDQMVAIATNLKANADGMLGNIAAGLIRPHLQKLDSVPVPLMNFSMGNVKLRSVKAHTGDGLHITAAFGGQPA